MERALCAAGGGEPALSIETIEEAVVEAFNVSRRDMPGGRPELRINNYPSYVRQARKAAIYLCRKLTDEPPAGIGARFGFAARTVGGVTRTVERLIDSDPAFAACLGGALSLLQAGFGHDDSPQKKLPQS